MQEARETVMEPYDEGPQLRDYMMSLWRWRWLVLATTVVCAAIAFLVGRQSSPVYEASAKVIMSSARPGDAAPPITVATYRSVVENQTLAAQVIREFRLDAEPARLSPQRFLADAVAVDNPRETNIVVIRVRLGSKDLPAKVANRVAALSIDLAQRLSQDDKTHGRDVLKGQLDQARARFEVAQAQYRNFRQKAQIEILRQDVDAELGERYGLASVSVAIESARARIAKSEEELAKRQTSSGIGKAVAGAPGLEAGSDYPNRVYDRLDQQVAESRAELSGLEKKRAELLGRLKLGSPQSNKLNALYAEEAQLDQLETDLEVAKKTYVDIATRYEQLRLQATATIAPLQVLDAAVPPDGPTGPRVWRNTAAAAVAGLLLASLAALFLSIMFPSTPVSVSERRG